MKVVCIAGRSDAGKTTLIESLIPVLGGDGRVATIKSIHHDIEIDEQGKDTYRHRTAGADRVVGVTPSLTFSIIPRGKQDDPDGESVILRILETLTEYDYVLVEGFAGVALPTILVGEDRVDGVKGDVLVRISDPGNVDVVDLADRIRGLPRYELSNHDA